MSFSTQRLIILRLSAEQLEMSLQIKEVREMNEIREKNN